MANIQKLDDILEVAVRIERRGMEFYKKLADMVQSPQAKDAFLFLAAEEEKHIGIFRQMLEKVADYQPRFKYPGEYGLYLDGVSFLAIKSFEKMDKAIQSKNIGDALLLAMQVETDSINFYKEIFEHFEGKEKGPIQEVINEEKKHLAKLLSLKGMLKL
ncbi:MAG: ferritin family protein [Spirochaetes bacterium]|nr:ferritin family protein [Spirochaetota bacterium]